MPKDKLKRVVISDEDMARLEFIQEELGLTTRQEAVHVAIGACYETMVQKKITDVDPLWPLTSRLDAIEGKLDMVLPEIY